MKHPIAAFALVALTGCAFVQGQVAADSEEILAQAGFQRSPLDEPGLPSRQLIEDAGTYKFADPDFCPWDDQMLWGAWNPEGLNVTTGTSRRAALH
jgi:hypothetical protein